MHWEYMLVTETLDSDALNEFGVEGWELIAVASPGHFVLHHFFKRPLRP